MGRLTEITWTDSTFNPWWGCTRVSPGCEHCYAESLDKRIGGTHWGTLNAGATRRAMSESYWRQPEKWNAAAQRAGVRRRVFCASMADVFEDVDSPVVHEGRARLWSLLQRTPWLDWQLLSKRPENFARFLPWRSAWLNVWLGVTAEDQQRANERIPDLRNIPAQKSGPIGVDALTGGWAVGERGNGHRQDPRISWVICGAESGPGARPFNREWADSLRAQCRATGVAYFGKQDADGRGRKLPLIHADGAAVQEFPR